MLSQVVNIGKGNEKAAEVVEKNMDLLQAFLKSLLMVRICAAVSKRSCARQLSLAKLCLQASLQQGKAPSSTSSCSADTSYRTGRRNLYYCCNYGDAASTPCSVCWCNECTYINDGAL